MRVIIVDDETDSAQVLKRLLEQHLPQLHILAICHKPDDAIYKMATLNPDVVFLDIELPGMSGFDILDRIKNINFDVIFTTAHNQYGIKAIQFSAIDYLLKPIDPDELVMAIHRVEAHRALSNPLEKIKHLFENVQLLRNNETMQRVALPTSDGLKLVSLDQIIRCMASNNYTYIFLTNKEKLLISKSLKEIEHILPDAGFCRIHNSHLVNLKHIKKFLKGDTHTLVMQDNTELEVSRRKKDELIRLLNM